VTGTTPPLSELRRREAVQALVRLRAMVSDRRVLALDAGPAGAELVGFCDELLSTIADGIEGAIAPRSRNL